MFKSIVYSSSNVAAMLIVMSFSETSDVSVSQAWSSWAYRESAICLAESYLTFRPHFSIVRLRGKSCSKEERCGRWFEMLFVGVQAQFAGALTWPFASR